MTVWNVSENAVAMVLENVCADEVTTAGVISLVRRTLGCDEIEVEAYVGKDSVLIFASVCVDEIKAVYSFSELEDMLCAVKDVPSQKSTLCFYNNEYILALYEFGEPSLAEFGEQADLMDFERANEYGEQLIVESALKTLRMAFNL